MKNIIVNADFDITDETKEQYIKNIKDIMVKNNEDAEALARIDISLNKDNEQEVNICYYLEDHDSPKFERIARITGYLVGTIDRWNVGKQAELKDRVTHG